MIAGILEKRRADYLVWKSQCAETARRAAEQVKSFRKSNGGNRARGYYVDGLFAGLLGFWARQRRGCRQGAPEFVDEVCRGRGFRGS